MDDLIQLETHTRTTFRDITTTIYHHTSNSLNNGSLVMELNHVTEVNARRADYCNKINGYF